MRRIFQTNFNLTTLNIWLLILRVAIGSFMLTHGWGKMQNLISGDIKFTDPVGIGEKLSLFLTVFAEVVCSLMIIIGLATRIAVLPLMITMLVAAFIHHSTDPFGNKEVPLLYFLIYVNLLVCGSGKFSLDFIIHQQD
jgi:putative oxidoreductase